MGTRPADLKPSCFKRSRPSVRIRQTSASCGLTANKSVPKVFRRFSELEWRPKKTSRVQRVINFLYRIPYIEHSSILKLRCRSFPSTESRPGHRFPSWESCRHGTSSPGLLSWCGPSPRSPWDSWIIPKKFPSYRSYFYFVLLQEYTNTKCKIVFVRLQPAGQRPWYELRWTAKKIQKVRV